MNESRLEPYRDEILAMKMRGMNTAAIHREIEQRHRVTLKKTQFYKFVNQITGETSPEPEGEFTMAPNNPPPYSNPVDEETRALLRAMLTNFDQVRHELAKVIHWQTQLDQKEERRELATRETLQQYQQKTRDDFQQFQQTLADLPRQLQAALPAARPFETPRPAAAPSVTSAFRAARGAMPAFTLSGPRSWKRALLYTGMLWGGVVWLFVYGHWRPLWAAVLQWAGMAVESALHT
jgi:hypothetical protein